jgi:hypothetical protein
MDLVEQQNRCSPSRTFLPLPRGVPRTLEGRIRFVVGRAYSPVSELSSNFRKQRRFTHLPRAPLSAV